jgi:hypothetical protein
VTPKELHFLTPHNYLSLNNSIRLHAVDKRWVKRIQASTVYPISKPNHFMTISFGVKCI